MRNYGSEPVREAASPNCDQSGGCEQYSAFPLVVAEDGHVAGAASALRIYYLVQQNPFLTSNQLVQKTGLSAPTVNAALADLEKIGIVEEITGRRRRRVFSYRRYLVILRAFASWLLKFPITVAHASDNLPQISVLIL